MKIRIKKNAYVFTDNSKVEKYLKDNEGKWIDVETTYLFNNQYNTKDFRIFDSMIDAVDEDERINKGTCVYCGSMINKTKGQIKCNKYAACNKYGIEWFTPENTFFLKYPNSLPQSLQKIESFTVKFGTYYLHNYNDELGYFRISNYKKTINFIFDKKTKIFYIHNNIGYKETENLSIPQNAQKKLIEYLMNFQD